MRMDQIALAVLPFLMVCGICAAETPVLDAQAAIEKLFESRDKMVSGRCSIAGVTDAKKGSRQRAVGEERLELVFDDRIPAYWIEEGLERAFLITPEFQYHATDSRSFVSRFTLGYNLRNRGGLLPFRPQSLGFYANPGWRQDVFDPTYDELKEWFQKAEILESEMQEDLHRIKVKLPRRHERDRDITMQLWLNPKQDYTTVRIEELYPDRAGYEFRSDMLWEKVNDVWVIAYFRQFQGFREKFTWKLSWTDVNQPIDESEFVVERIPNPGREASLFAERSLEGGESGSLRPIISNLPQPEGEPDWDSVLPQE